jgi:hypothetical protein
MSEEVTEGRRKLHNEELHDLSNRIIISGCQIKNEMGGANDTHEEKEKFIQDFGQKPRRKETTWKTYAQMG